MTRSDKNAYWGAAKIVLAAIALGFILGIVTVQTQWVVKLLKIIAGCA